MRSGFTSVVGCVVSCLALAGAGMGQLLSAEVICDSARLNAETKEARAAISAQRWAEAAERSRELIRICPGDARGYHFLGVALLGEDRNFAAIRALESALERKPDAATHLLLAKAFARLNQEKFFHEEINAAIALAPRDPEPYMVLGEHYFSGEDRMDLASAAFKQAVERKPDLRAICYLGMSLEGMNQDAEAEAKFREAIRLTERQSKPWDMPYQLLGTLCLAAKRTPEALNAAKRAVAIAPGRLENQFLLAKAAWAAGERDLALAAAKESVALDGEYAEARFFLAQIYRSLDKPDEMKEELDAFQRLERIYGRTGH